MRRLLALVGFSLLALPSSAAAQSLEYAAPTASISRGAPLTFAVRTDAPAGSVVVRVSGYDETDDSGLLTGPDGTWVDEIATPALDNLQVWSVPATSVLRQRPGHYYWQAYLTGAAADGAEEPVGPVQELVVTTPLADRGRGKLYLALRQARQGRLLPLVRELPGDDRRQALPDAREDDRVALGADGQAVDERRGGRPGRLQRRRVFHSRAG